MTNSIDKLADSLYKALSERDKRQKKGYDTPAKVTRISDDGQTVWVHIDNGVDETPVQRTNNARIGDTVMVRIANGRAWLLGNRTNPATDDTTAIQATRYANDAAAAAESAQNSAEIAYQEAARAHDAADSASAAAIVANQQATQAIADAATAKQSADRALVNLATVESVVDTLQWLTDHSTVTSDTSPVEDKTYYLKNPDGTFVKITDTEGKNPHEEGWYEMDEAVSNYVASHLALTDSGLDLLIDGNHYSIHIGVNPTTGLNEGVYILDEYGDVVTFFGESIDFSSTRVQHIGNNNAYIIFDPTNNGSITIGGTNIYLGDSRTLDEVLDDIDNALIYDHTYSVLNSTVTFLPHVYRAGVEVTTEFAASCFVWKYRTIDGSEVVVPTDSTTRGCSISISEMGYGANVISTFTPA